MTTPGGFLRPAVFRTASFFARRDTRAFPRSLQVDEYPASDRWSIVDLGRKAVTYRIEAYVADEQDVEARKDALEAALSAPGPGLLILPQRRPVMAWARAPETSWDQKETGYFTLRVEFVEDGPAFGSAPSLGLAERVLVDAMGRIAGLGLAAASRLASRSAGDTGLASYEAAAFTREAASRLAGFKADALALSAEDEVVEAVQTAVGFAGQADIAEALSVIGEAGLTALDARAAA